MALISKFRRLQSIEFLGEHADHSVALYHHSSRDATLECCDCDEVLVRFKMVEEAAGETPEACEKCQSPHVVVNAKLCQDCLAKDAA